MAGDQRLCQSPRIRTMSAEKPEPKDNLKALFTRLATGDETAAMEIVAQYANAIRFVIRKRLAKSRLRNIMDSMDILQSVFGRLFVWLRGHPYDFNKDEEILKWLTTVAKNRVSDHERHYAKEMDRRDYRSRGDTSFLEERFETFDIPEKTLPRRQTLESIRPRMSTYEWLLVEARAQGRSWKEIAAELGGSPDRARMRVKRVLDRIKREVELEKIQLN
jgi:RNA polymerase sigma factor (sigma-70 family)